MWGLNPEKPSFYTLTQSHFDPEFCGMDSKQNMPVTSAEADVATNNGQDSYIHSLVPLRGRRRRRRRRKTTSTNLKRPWLSPLA